MAIIEGQKIQIRWNNANKKWYIEKGYEFTNNGDEFYIDVKDITKGSKTKVGFICDNEECDNVFTREYQIATRRNKQYCCHECSASNYSRTRLEKRIEKTCEECNQMYYVPKNLEHSSRFCCKDCMQQWQSKAFKGEGSSKYVERIEVSCDYCSEVVKRTPNYLSKRVNNFCGIECKDKYHHEIFMQSDEWKEFMRKQMINNLTNGLISFTESRPQIELNRILDNLKINYINEYPTNYYSFDNYLSDFGLIIEVNGGFWHCDNREYKTINYENQVNRIVSDKRKNTFIKNETGKNILYLWEYDILIDEELCISLIEEFVKNKGMLKNYHSFNYHLDKEGNLKLNENIIKPYMDYDPSELNLLIDLETRKKSGRGTSTVRFACDQCGNEGEYSTSQYLRAKNHFCSKECSLAYKKRKSEVVNCDNCNKEITLPSYRIKKIKTGEQKNVFCSRECRVKFK